MNEPTIIEPGDWFLMQFGFERNKFYVAEVAGSRFRLSKAGWCSNDGAWLTKEEMQWPGREAEYIGRGAPKRMWKWIPWRILIVPFHQPTSTPTQP